MRSLFTVPEGKVLVGYDASSLEDRVKAHYLYNIDGGELAKKVADGTYDPHQESADVWGLPRSKAKNGNYALQYLCQPPTLAKTLGCSIPEAEEYHKLYWELNWALDEFVNQVKRAWVNNNKKFVRTIDHSKIYTRYEHSIANAVMQSTGAKIMDMSYAYLRKWLKGAKIDAKRVLYQHDEIQLECNPEDAERVGELGCESIRKAGEFFKLNCPMDAQYAVGTSWSDTH
jgi:DNA polymerase I-like protein with 3'-5' exonuclease and polymerase domains